MILERSKYAYNSKDAVFYGNHKQVPVWITLVGLTDEQKKLMQGAMGIEGLRQLPWPSTFYKEAIQYITENAYPKLFKGDRPVEIKEQVLVEMLDVIMRHFNNIVGPNPDYGFYLDSQFILQEDKELQPAFDSILAKQEPITLSTMFDTLRSNDGVWVSFIDYMNEDISTVLRMCAMETVIISNTDKAYTFSEVVNIKGVKDEDLGEVFENAATRNMKKAQKTINSITRG